MSDLPVSRETHVAQGVAHDSVRSDTIVGVQDTPIARAVAAALDGRVKPPVDPVGAVEPAAGPARLPRPQTPRILAVSNQKGGVGKTTTTVNLAAALAMHGLRVLVIDLDPQGNASTALGVDHPVGTPSIYEVLLGGLSLAEAAVPCAEHTGLMCVPATIDLAGAEIELISLVSREARLKRAITAYLSQPEPADYVLIDCPPSLGQLTINALVAAGEVFIPIQCEYYALEGLGQLQRIIGLVQADLNPALRVSTILLTMYNARTRLADQVAAEVRTHFPDLVLQTIIPRSVRLSEAPSYGQTVLAYDPGSRGAQAYVEAARELATRADAPTSPAGEASQHGSQQGCQHG